MTSVYEAGDISRPQVIPHSAGVYQYALADSPLRRGIVPGNVSQKKYIAAMANFAPHLAKGFIKETRAPTKVREFAADYDPTRALALEVEKQKDMSRNRKPETAGQVIEKFARIQEEGPREHPEYTLVSGVKTNLSSATAIARALAELPSAPTDAKPRPDHHFIHGGSLKQKKKLDKKIKQRERVIEANLYQRKQNLVDKNLAELQRLSEAQDAEENQLQEPFPEPVVNPAAERAAAAGTETASATSAPASTSKTTAAPYIIGGGVIFLGIILSIAAYRMRSNRKQA
jgi:hypothetical protein